jgi:hypothetical protein
VEARVDVRIPFLTGLGSASAGAFIRSCTSDFGASLRDAWCGAAPLPGAAALAHEHCLGCGLIAAGMALIAIAPLLLQLPSGRLAKAMAA